LAGGLVDCGHVTKHWVQYAGSSLLVWSREVTLFCAQWLWWWLCLLVLQALCWSEQPFA